MAGGDAPAQRFPGPAAPRRAGPKVLPPPLSAAGRGGPLQHGSCACTEPHAGEPCAVSPCSVCCMAQQAGSAVAPAAEAAVRDALGAGGPRRPPHEHRGCLQPGAAGRRGRRAGGRPAARRSRWPARRAACWRGAGRRLTRTGLRARCRPRGARTWAGWRAAAAAQQRRRLSGCPGAGCMLLEGPGPCSAHGRRQPTPVHQCAREMARCLPCGEPQHRRPSAAAADPVRRARLQLEDLAAAERRVRSLLVDPAVADSEDELF